MTRGPRKHINFLNINFLAPTQNTPFWAPRRKFMCLIPGKGRQKGTHINFFGWIFGVNKGAPNRPFSATKSLVYFPALNKILKNYFSLFVCPRVPLWCDLFGQHLGKKSCTIDIYESLPSEAEDRPSRTNMHAYIWPCNSEGEVKWDWQKIPKSDKMVTKCDKNEREKGCPKRVSRGSFWPTPSASPLLQQVSVFIIASWPEVYWKRTREL